MEYLVAALSAIPAIREVSLTTNGSLLPRMAQNLKAAGLGRVNISLDSLDEERFSIVSRGGSLKRTLDGIQAAQQAGLTPIRLNTVLQRSTWQLEVPRLLDYAATTGFEIRFIELMRTGTERTWCESEFVSIDEVSNGLNAEIVPIGGQSNSSARRTFVNWGGTRVTVGWISPRSQPFCDRCERLRMDARGRIRRCLMDPSILDLHKLLETADDSAAWQSFQKYLAGKVPPNSMDSAFAMSEIGG
jgi:cyclic pyranopterin phosphate synthase